MAVLNSKGSSETLILGVIPIVINKGNNFKVSVSSTTKFNKIRVDSSEDPKPVYKNQMYTDYTIVLEIIQDGGLGSSIIKTINAFTSKYSGYVDDKKEVPNMCKFDAEGNEVKVYEPTLLGKTAKAIEVAYGIGTRASYIGRDYVFFDLAIYNISSSVDENDPYIMSYTISCSDEYEASASKNTTTNVQVGK